MNPETNATPPVNPESPNPQSAQPPTLSPEPAPAVTEPVAPVANPSPTGTSSPIPARRPVLLIVAGIAVFLALILGAIWWVTRPSASADRSATDKAAQNSTSQSGAISLATLAGAALIPPADLGGLKPYDLGVPEAKDYRNGTTTSGCELQFGTFTAAQVPGVDLSDIVAKQLAAVRQAGGTVKGPDSGAALVMKDTANGKKLYSLPTLVFSITLNGSQATSHYSAGVLANGSRVAVTRVCAAKVGQAAPADSSIKALDDIAGRITVQSGK